MKKRKILAIALIVLLTVCLITAVACDKTEQHDFDTAWSYDESMHWHKCKNQDCQEKSNWEEHDLQQVGTFQTCAVCGYSFNTANTYEINLQTLGGTVIAGVDVTLLDQNNQQVAKAKSNIRGKVRFTNVNPSNYVAKIDADTLPKGYYIPQGQDTVELTATTMKATVQLPSTLIDEEMPAGHRYKLGEVMYNFKTTAVDKTGKETNVSLSAYLTKYKAVVLNFWYSNCNPCLSEFPHMNEAYASYNQDIAIVAISGGSKVGDSVEIVENFATKSGYDFNFVNDEKMFDFTEAFGVIAYPTTVIVDRYGAIAYVSKGADTSTSSWKNLFAHYVDDDYVPNYVSGFDQDNTPGGGNDLTKPDVEMPQSEEIANKITKVNTLTSKETFTYSPYNDEYAWPWVLAEKDGKECLKTSNYNKLNSYSMLVIDVQLKAGQQVFADLFVSTEEDTDVLYVQVDTILQHLLSGQDNAWRDDQLLYVAQRDGQYQIVLTYQKSLMTNAGDDTVYIKNLRIENGAPTNGAIDLLYNATDNYTLDTNAKVPEANKGSLNHVEYYFNEKDGFYHVALVGNAEKPSPEDPYLLANMVLTSHWNSEFSVWNLAFAGAGLFNENDPDYKEGCYQAVEDYSWLQNNSASGYVPVNQELYNILNDVVADLGRTDDSQDCHPDGTTCSKGENCHKGNDQWLEICRYYVHYGDDHTQGEKPYPKTDFCYSLDNTIEALKWRVAKDYGQMVDKLVIDIDVYSYHVPRGNYYRFVPTKTGAYKVYSTAKFGSDNNLSTQDPLGFVADAKGNIIAENDNYVIEAQGKDDKGDDVYDNNFYMFVYLLANETYYVAGCFSDPTIQGNYQATVEYIGESYTYFTSCAIDPTYTYDENDPNFTPIIIPKMGKDKFFLGDDGIYYAQEFDGSQGSPLYVRMVGPTYYSSYTMMTLEQMIEADLVNASQADKLYLKHMLNQARNETNPTLNGYVVATERLVSILNKVVNGSDTEDSNTYSQTGWLLTTYYFCNVNELTLQQAQAKYN